MKMDTKSIEVKNGDCTLQIRIKAQSNLREVLEAIKNKTLELKVGDYITTHLKDGTEVDFIVTHKSDKYYRFESRDCVGDEVVWSKNRNTSGGYPGSDVRKYVDKTIWELLPDELKEKIIPTVRKYKDIDGEVKEFETKLFLPAASEVFDEERCYGDEGVYEQLEYYKDRRNRMRADEKGGYPDWYWLSSAVDGSSALACFVSNHGYAGHNYASYAYRVPVCFHIEL